VSQSVRNKANAEHYTWGQQCDAWYLLKSAALTVIQERMPPGSEETKHKHGKSRQFFFVLAGEATMLLDNVELRIPAGQGIEVAPQIAHKIKNASADGDLEFLIISQPPSHNDRIDLQ
jgi:mannose-6-phosphate isomerase-like protein (cupin superfamily)